MIAKLERVDWAALASTSAGRRRARLRGPTTQANRVMMIRRKVIDLETLVALVALEELGKNQ